MKRRLATVLLLLVLLGSPMLTTGCVGIGYDFDDDEWYVELGFDDDDDDDDDCPPAWASPARPGWHKHPFES